MALENGAIMTALTQAAFDGDLKGCKALLLENADPNSLGKDTEGYTSLMFAALTNHPHTSDIVRLLLDNGAERKIKNSRGVTAASMALFVGHANQALLINTFVPQSIFTTFVNQGLGNLQITSDQAVAFYNLFNSTSIDPADVSEQILSVPAIWGFQDVLQTVANIAAKEWNNKVIALKLLYLCGMMEAVLTQGDTNQDMSNRCKVVNKAFSFITCVPEIRETVMTIKLAEDSFGCLFQILSRGLI